MTAAADPSAVVVSAARNEAGTIGKVVAEALIYFGAVVVVDDGSVDETAAIARASGATVVQHPLTLGYGAALASGVKFARQFGASAVVLLDGDGAHRAEDGARLLSQHVAENADLTIGTRLSRRMLVDIPSSKRSANVFATSLFNRVTGCDISDAASGLRVVGRRSFPIVLESGEDFGAAFEIAARVFAAGQKIAEGPISVRYDARNLFGTTTLELLQFLSFCSRRSDFASSSSIENMILLVERRHRAIGVELNATEFFLHYVQEHDMYVFQQQDPWFATTYDAFRVFPC